jgi:RNA polymerase sigma factor (sigma-70 family)
MTTEEIVAMCEKLANKYRQYHLTKDLVSEGILAVYERLADKPDEYPASLYRRANKAMYDYINIKNKPVSIPSTRTAEAISKGKEYEGQTHSEEGKKVLEEALNSTSVEFDGGFMVSVEDCSEGYERKEYLHKAMGKLDQKERDVVRMRYYNDMTQEDIAHLYGVSQQSVALWEEVALKKMSKL